MTKEFKSEAEKYECSRDVARIKARSDFLKLHEKSNFLITSLNEIVARHMFYINGKSWSHIANGEYYNKLIVSFTRTHFVLYDLIICNELIDASVLFRKQLELVSRLYELDGDIPINKLLKKTPNIKHLEFDLNKLYSDYSEVSHSSDIEKLQLLGTTIQKGKTYTSVYPQFDENSYVSYRHLFLLVTQYHYWIAEKYESWFEGYERKGDCTLYAKCYEAFNDIYYGHPMFKKLGAKQDEN